MKLLIKMTKISAIYKRLEKLTQTEGQSEFISVLSTNLINYEGNKNSTLNHDDVSSYQLLRTFLTKIFEAIDDLSTEILNDNSILISVKNQKLIRTCFQLITSVGLNVCLIPGIGISLSKRCLSSNILPPMKFKDEEKYELLVECTNFFTRCYKVPVLKNVIITLHLSDYLAALIQLAFAPLKKPGSYTDFVMTQEMYDKINGERQKFLAIYEHLVSNCFQPILMKELLVLQSVVHPSPPGFVKRVIAKELSRRLLAPGGVLSLIRCFIESYEVDTGLEWKKIEMICRIVSTKHGTGSEDDYLQNITSQLTNILSLHNTHYLATSVACVLSLKEKFPDSEPIKFMVKDIFQAFDYDNLVSKCNLPGTVILSPQEVDHKVNILNACVCSTKSDWQASLIEPNIQILFNIGGRCNKNQDLKTKIKEILVKFLEKLNKSEITYIISMLLFNKYDKQKLIEIEEYESGISIKFASTQKKENNANNELLFFLEMYKSLSDVDLVKSVFEASLDMLIDLSLKRKKKANKDLLALEEDPILLDTIDENYATVLQLLSEISGSPKLISILKKNPAIVINFIEHFIFKSNHASDEECTTIALVLLTTVLSNAHRDDVLEKKMMSLAPILTKMSNDESGFNHLLCKEALSLMSFGVPQEPQSACGKALTEVFDNLLPVRAHGIIELTKLIDAKDAETISKKHYIFCIFQEQLKDPDSYIYLSAINGLASLCTHCTEDVLHVLCTEFLQISMDQNNMKTNMGQNRTAELRMKTGDVIVKVIRRLGEMAVVNKTILLNTMLSGCRDDDPLIRTSALSNLAEIALVLHYKIGTILYEVLLCVWSIIETDKAIECRRAAVMVISSLLKGLGKETLVQLKENLLPIYRTLKSLYRDNDEDSVVRLHAQIALEELNDIVNQFLNPELNMGKQTFVMDKPEVEIKFK